MCSGQKAIQWTIEQDEILINFVRNHECLYNIQCKDYRKAQLKQNLWKEIAEILYMKDSDCSKRWGYVRDYYIRRAKPGTGSSGEAAKKRSEQLSFLDGISSMKRSFSTLSNKGQCESENNVESNTADLYKDTSNLADGQCELLTEDDISDDISYTQNAEIDLVTTPKAKRNVCIPQSPPADKRLKIFKQIAERPDERKVEKEEDENDLFFASMTKIIKKLPAIVQATLRMQVGNLIGNAEVEHLSTASPPFRPSSAASSTTSTSNVTFITEDLVTPIEPPATIISIEDNYFINL